MVSSVAGQRLRPLCVRSGATDYGTPYWHYPLPPIISTPCPAPYPLPYPLTPTYIKSLIARGLLETLTPATPEELSLGNWKDNNSPRMETASLKHFLVNLDPHGMSRRSVKVAKRGGKVKVVKQEPARTSGRGKGRTRDKEPRDVDKGDGKVPNLHLTRLICMRFNLTTI
jgi:hypothetical protein